MRSFYADSQTITLWLIKLLVLWFEFTKLKYSGSILSCIASTGQIRTRTVRWVLVHSENKRNAFSWLDLSLDGVSLNIFWKKKGYFMKNIVRVQTMGPIRTVQIVQMKHCHLVVLNSALKRFHIINLYTLGC